MAEKELLIAGINYPLEQEMVNVEIKEDGTRKETPAGSLFRRKGTIVEHGKCPRRSDGKRIRRGCRVSKHDRAKRKGD